MKKERNGKLEIYRFEKLSCFSEIEHFVSTRKGGVSEGSHESLNLGLHVDDKREAVLENRKILSGEIGVPQEKFVYLNQTQSNNVLIAKKKHAGSGALHYEDSIQDTDGAITNEQGIVLTAMMADCASMLFFDPKKKVIGAVHAGWQGTLNQAFKAAIQKAKEEFDCDPKDIQVGMGPSLEMKCHEIQGDVIAKVLEVYDEKDEVLTREEGKVFFDVNRANMLQLMREGVLAENIETANVCTACNLDEFYSYRKEKVTGRFLAGIMLRSNS